MIFFDMLCMGNWCFLLGITLRVFTALWFGIGWLVGYNGFVWLGMVGGAGCASEFLCACVSTALIIVHTFTLLLTFSPCSWGCFIL